jgi:hypothetical protein
MVIFMGRKVCHASQALSLESAATVWIRLTINNRYSIYIATFERANASFKLEVYQFAAAQRQLSQNENNR